MGKEQAVELIFPKGKVVSGRKIRELLGPKEIDAIGNIERAATMIENMLEVHPLGTEAVRIDAAYDRFIKAFSAYQLKIALKAAA